MAALPSHVKSMDWCIMNLFILTVPYISCYSVKSLKLLHVAFVFLQYSFKLATLHCFNAFRYKLMHATLLECAGLLLNINDMHAVLTHRVNVPNIH